jgi:hypothetical protein
MAIPGGFSLAAMEFKVVPDPLSGTAANDCLPCVIRRLGGVGEKPFSPVQANQLTSIQTMLKP